MSKQEKGKRNYYDKFRLYIYDKFDREMVDLLFELDKDLSGHPQSDKLQIFINSNGGEQSILYGLLQRIEHAKRMNLIVETYVDGSAFSCASVLAASGSKGHRYVTNFSTHLLHLGYGTINPSTDLQLERESKFLKKHFEHMRTLYKKYSNIENLDEKLKDDSFFLYGKEIIDNGLADILLK